MAHRLPQRSTAALARPHVQPRNRADHLDVPRRTTETGNAAQGTDARQRSRLLARGRAEHRPNDRGVALVPAEDRGSRLVEFTGIADPPEREPSRRRSSLPGKDREAHSPRGPWYQ